MIEKNKFGY